jgi:hypothetical protein
MANRIGGRMDEADIRVGVGAIGAIVAILAARATANKDAVAKMVMSRGSTRDSTMEKVRRL